MEESRSGYKLGRKMVWSNTARLYMSWFELARRRGAAPARELVSARGFVHAA